jgi:hypothetical protein
MQRSLCKSRYTVGDATILVQVASIVEAALDAGARCPNVEKKLGRLNPRCARPT